MANAKLKSVEKDTRAPVKARGLELLKLIATSGGLYLTQAEASEALNAGHVVVNFDDTQGDTCLVTLSDAGKALVAPPAPAAPKSAIEIDDDVPMVEKKRGGRRGSKYPFDDLPAPVNGKPAGSFHVPKTADNPDPVSALASSLTGARRRFSKPMTDSSGEPVMETVKIKVYKLDAAGKRIKGDDGKWIVTGEVPKTQQKTVAERDFMVAEVGTEDKRGPGARVWRTK